MIYGENSLQEASERKYYGKYPGVVKGNEPADDNTPHRGELLVEVPGILEEKDRKPIVVTAAPCFPPGFFFIPEAGDNVWVEFAAGDINSPVWTGVWYAKDKAPKAVDAPEPTPTRFQKIIRTSSKEEIVHEILLDDTGRSEKIVIRDRKNDRTITLDARGITLKGDVFVEGVLTVGSGPKTTIDGNKITGG